MGCTVGGETGREQMSELSLLAGLLAWRVVDPGTQKETSIISPMTCPAAHITRKHGPVSDGDVTAKLAVESAVITTLPPFRSCWWLDRAPGQWAEGRQHIWPVTKWPLATVSTALQLFSNSL